MIVAVMTTALTMSAAEEVYSTCLFGPDYNSQSIGSYTATWTTTNGDFTWTIVNGNNNNNNWNFVKFGRKNNTSVGTITTSAAYSVALTKVDVTIDAITAANVNSIKLYTSADNDTWTEAGNFSKSTGTQTVNLTSPTTNLYYKIEFDCASGSANGLVTVSKVEYYYNTGGAIAPSITAANISIAYDATEGEIEYTVNNPVTGGTLSASTTSDWLAVGDVDDTVPFYCDSNNGSARIATVTLTYAYGSESVTKNVTVTQAGNPNGPGSKDNPYTVAEARAAIDAGTGLTGVYATGIVTAIPTAWSTQYNNITFNFVDANGDEEFLQAFRCVSTENADASTVAVGDIVVVKGDLKKYNSTYEFDAACELVSLTHPIVAVEAPTFNPAAGTYAEAQSVTIGTTTAGATIYYTTDGTEPTTNSDVYSSAISVSTTTTIKAIAVKGEDQSAVATATYYFCSATNPYTVTDALAFPEYPANGIYVSGIVSTAPTQTPTSNGQLTYYISADGEATDQLQVYKGKGLEQAAFTAQDDIQVGDIVTIYGNVKIYNGTKEFDTDNYLVSFERPVGPTVPVINAEDATITYDVTYYELMYSIDNPVEGTELTATTTASWITSLTPSQKSFDRVMIECTENDTDADRTAVITLTYGEVTKDVTLTQTHYVADYATLPFVFNGTKDDIESTNGLTQSGIGKDYSSSTAPTTQLKFDSTGDYLILKINEEPGLLAFDIKGNSFENGTFTVQTSENGETYTDLATYTELGATQTESFTLASNVRYIKWVYTEKVTGNVGLGNIQVYSNKPVEVTISEAGYATMYLPYAVEVGGVLLSSNLPTPIGAWTFDDPQNPLAGIGTATLTPANHSTSKPTWLETRESLEAANIQVIDGGLYLPMGSSLLMNTNTEKESFSTYTVMFDICSDDVSGYTPLWQNSMSDSKDGSLFIKNGQIGLGGSLSYNGLLNAGQWYRVVFVVESTGEGTGRGTLYVDGEFISTSEQAAAYNTHWVLPEPGAVFFADEDGEEKAIKVTGLRFWDVPLTASQVSILGSTTVTSEGETIIASVPEATGVWTFDDPDDLTAATTGISTMTATNGVVVNGDGSVTVAEGDNLKITTNLQETSLDSYTLMMDVKFPDVARYTSLIQTDLDNVADACLFVHNGQVGINSGGLYYHGSLENDTWYRLVFVVDGLIASEYIDGVLVGKGSSTLQKWGIGTGFFLFEDEDDDNDEGVATTTEIRFWNKALTPGQVALLGTMDAESVLKAYTGVINGEYLTLSEVKGTIPAYTPVVLKAAQNTYVLNIAEDVAPISENDLKGTLEDIDATGKYILAKPEGEQVGFYLANSGTIKAGKAYLENTSGIKAFYFGQDDDATAIEDVNVNETQSVNDGAIYNLAGQRVDKMQHGIYIVNGKKILK